MHITLITTRPDIFAAVVAICPELCDLRVLAGEPELDDCALLLVGSDVTEPHGTTALRPVMVGTGLDLDDAGIWDRAVASHAEHLCLLPDGNAWLSELMLTRLTPSQA